MPPKRRRKPSRLPQLLALGGFILIVFAVLALKEKPEASNPIDSANLLAEVQLDQALAAQQPVLAFIHSDTCQQCQIMMDTVADVYPQFEGRVVLVDVNVYDTSNEPLLQRLRVRYIPTLVFFDQRGEAQTSVGVMEAGQLGERLAALAAGK